MASRSVIIPNFANTRKPDGPQFAEWINSCLNIDDDQIQPIISGAETYIRIGFGPTSSPTPPLPRLEINGGIQLGGTEASMPAAPEGSLIYDASDNQLKIRDNVGWSIVGSGGGAIPGITNNGGNLELNVVANTNTISLGIGPSNILRVGALAGGVLGVQIDGRLEVTGYTDLQGGGQINPIGPAPPEDITSDRRVKSNVSKSHAGLDEILKINPVEFQYNGKGNTEKGKAGLSVIAQELKEIFPNLVNTYEAKLNPEDEDTTELYSITPTPLIFVLINAIKELYQKIEQLEQPLNANPATL